MSVYYSCKPFFLFLKFSRIFVLRLGLAVGILHIWEPAVGMGGGGCWVVERKYFPHAYRLLCSSVIGYCVFRII